MNLEFKETTTGDTFSLGTWSFDFLNRNDVFDESNKDNDELSERIVWLNFLGCIDVSKKSIDSINNSEKLREDLRDKIKKFSIFLLNCNEVEAYIK